mgnify:FL=1
MIKLKKFKGELFTTMIPPSYQKVCITPDEYFDLIKYCWECIGDVSEALVSVNFYHSDSQFELTHYKASLLHLHRRINECYEHLKTVGYANEVKPIDVYTAPLSQGRG